MRSGYTYALMLAFLFSHEVDAAFRLEWRVLPITSQLADDLGREVFTWLHIPMFGAILAFSSNTQFRAGLAAFCIIHIGLHWLLRNHPSNQFNNPTSWLLILGAGLVGLTYLLQTRRRNAGSGETKDGEAQ
jgi:LPXTG-motif cell wall-anchored protein